MLLRQGLRLSSTTADAPERTRPSTDYSDRLLVWAKASGGSERQLRDVAGVVTAAGDSLDRDYVEHWVDRLSVRELWERVTSA